MTELNRGCPIDLRSNPVNKAYGPVERQAFIKRMVAALNAILLGDPE